MQEVNLFAIYTDILNKNNFQYYITGSVASIIYGEPRLTHYIDLVINLSEKDVDKFVNVFPHEKFYCPPKEIIKTELKRTNRGHFNLIHHETGFKADIYFIGEDELQQWALINRKVIEFAGSKIFVAPPEYIIIKKLEFFKEGKSDKHVTDIEGILRNSDELINKDFLEKNISQYGLKELWEKVNKNLN